MMLQVFNGDITGPDGAAIEAYTALNGSFESVSGNFTIQYGEGGSTWALAFNATQDEVENALEVGSQPVGEACSHTV